MEEMKTIVCDDCSGQWRMIQDVDENIYEVSNCVFCGSENIVDEDE